MPIKFIQHTKIIIMVHLLVFNNLNIIDLAQKTFCSDFDVVLAVMLPNLAKYKRTIISI